MMQFMLHKYFWGENMKPIIIYTGQKDEVKLTKEEFEKYINEAYDQGYKNGYSEGIKWGPIRSTIPYSNNPDIITTPKLDPFKYTTITCEAHNAVE